MIFMQNFESKFRNAIKWGYPAVPFYTSVYFLVSKKRKLKYFSTWKFVCKCDNYELVGYNSRSNIGKNIINDLLMGKKDYLKSLKRIHSEIKSTTILLNKIRKSSNKLDTKHWWFVGQKAFSDGANIIFSFDYEVENYLNKLKVTDLNTFQLIKENIIDEKESFITKAENDFKKIFLKNSKNQKKAFDEFSKKYGWLHNSYLGKSELDKKHFLRLVNKKNVKLKLKKEKSKINKKYVRLIDAINYSIIVRDDRKKMFLILIEIMNNWLEKICKENNWNLKEMEWLSLDEVQECINGNVKLLQDAKGYYKNKKRVYTLIDSKIVDIDENIFLKIKNINSKFEDKIQIKGTIANKGFVKGKVRVILNPNLKNDFKKGEILVTSMTRPDFVPLMQKAGAFVTDEGGLTCHAGIVARELNKPCIVGTKIATQFFKDGDLVEVDANNGFVRKIK